MSITISISRKKWPFFEKKIFKKKGPKISENLCGFVAPKIVDHPWRRYMAYVHHVCTWGVYMAHMHSVCAYRIYMAYVHSVCT